MFSMTKKSLLLRKCVNFDTIIKEYSLSLGKRLCKKHFSGSNPDIPQGAVMHPAFIFNTFTASLISQWLTELKSCGIIKKAIGSSIRMSTFHRVEVPVEIRAPIAVNVLTVNR